MAGPRTMHDIRSARSIATRAMPTSEGAIFLQLHHLASEKLRLENEAELWLRKKERIEKRLGEIEQQMESMRLRCPGITVKSRINQPKHAWTQVTVEY